MVAVKELQDCLDGRVIAGAMARGVEALVIGHLRRRNASTPPNRHGLPKSNYYADAAKDVQSTVRGATAVVDVSKEGLALHYFGGEVLPEKKALAVPIDPTVAGIWPSECVGELSMIWPKNADHGFLKDPESGDLLYLLLPKATIKADPSVLPTDGEILNAAENAVLEALS